MASEHPVTPVVFDEELKVDPNDLTGSATLDDEGKKYGLEKGNDQTSRLTLQHRIWKLTLEDKLSLTPLPSPESGKVRDVIDLGCGTGAWALDFATSYSSATVLGIDTNPLNSTSDLPPNLHFRTADATTPTAFLSANPSRPPGFDLIHTRSISSGIKSWPSLISLIWDNLRPSGWVELQEFHLPMMCDDGSLGGETALGEWNEKFIQASKVMGVDFGAAFAGVPPMLGERGAVGVAGKGLRWPVGPWAREERWKSVGGMFRADLSVVLGDVSRGLFTKCLGMELEAVEELWSRVEAEMMEGKVHAYVPIHIVWGQKPEEGAEE